MRLSEEVWLQAQALVAQRLGLDLPEHRRADLERGLLGACHACSMPSPERYLAWLASLSDEHPAWGQCASYLTVGETYFFRDRAAFDALAQHVLPSLIAARRAEDTLRLRLWSAGCATGEEPYSLAILLDRLLPDRSEWAITILATDVNPRALDIAQRGRYREWSFRDTPRWIRDRWFHHRGAERIEVEARIRRMVTFAPLNLADDGYPSLVTNTTAMDVILCRNVLMYFTGEALPRTVARLRRALAIGGWLLVSPAEASVELFRPLAPVNFPGTIFYRNDPASGISPLPRAPAETLPHAFTDLALTVYATSSDHASLPTPVKSRHEEHGEAGADVAADLQRARLLADQGNLDEARKLCEAALLTHRLDPEIHLLLAAISQEQGEIPSALEALRRAIYLAPELATPYFLLGSLLIRRGERKRGRRAMETAVSLLSAVPADAPLPGGDGLTAGRLLESARMYLELHG
jgi:chemotaxis protein methyltransferase CheR